MLVYKIVGMREWRAAEVAGLYRGSADDLRDGFIHLSTARQVPGTLERHFAGVVGLVLVAIEDSALGDDLKFEPSRGGDLFPHLHAPLSPELAVWERPITRGPDGSHVLPDLEP